MSREFFDGNTFRKVTNILKKGTEKKIVFRDAEAVGLCIRVQKFTAVWSLMTRDYSLKLAPFSTFTLEDLPDLRALIVEAPRQLAEGKEIETLFKTFVDVRTVKEAADHNNVANGSGMLWETARDEYLTWLKENRNKDTYRSYKSSLGACSGSVFQADYAPLAKRPIASITSADLARVKNNINRRGKEGDAKGRGIRQAELTVAALKSCFIHFVNHPEIFNLPSNPAESLSRVRDRVEREAAGMGVHERALTQLEIGAFIDAMEDCSNSRARLVLMLELLTGQRRLDCASAIRASFVPHTEYGLVWRLEDKVHAWRVLPLPNFAQDIVRAALDDAPSDEKHLFPKIRPAKMSDSREGHINERPVSRYMEELRRSGGVFEDLPFNASTHDLRKAMVTHLAPRMHKFEMDGARLTREDVVIITHKNEGRESTATMVYDKSEYLDVKFALLEEWQSYVEEGYGMWMQRKESEQQKKAA